MDGWLWIRFVAVLTVCGCVAFSAAAQSGDPRLAIKVVAKCDGSDAVFEMLNEGEKWPALAKVLIYRTDNKAVLSYRTLKMAGGQRLVHKTKGSTQGKIEIGFRIEPEWYDRPLAFDTAITCE